MQSAYKTRRAKVVAAVFPGAIRISSATIVGSAKALCLASAAVKKQDHARTWKTNAAPPFFLHAARTARTEVPHRRMENVSLISPAQAFCVYMILRDRYKMAAAIAAVLE